MKDKSNCFELCNFFGGVVTILLMMKVATLAFLWSIGSPIDIPAYDQLIEIENANVEEIMTALTVVPVDWSFSYYR